MIGYGCCVGDWAKFQRNVPHAVGGSSPLITVYGAPSIAVGYNMLLAAAETLAAHAELDALVLLHDDLEITDPEFEAKMLAALADPTVGVVGVVGSTEVRSLDWWARGLVGFQRTDTGSVIGEPVGGATVPVQAVDGSVLVLAPPLLERIRFDEQYPGWHGYDVDLCAQARTLGYQVLVADVGTWHHTSIGFKSAEIAASWDTAAKVYAGKWAT